MPDQSLFRIEPTLAGKQRECAAFSSSPFTTSVLIYCVCALLAIGLIYAGSQQVARKATVAGRAELSQGELKLYPNARRMVTEILVTEGQRVEEGQLLAILHAVQHAPTADSKQQSGYEKLLHSLQEQAVRLDDARNAARQRAAIEHDKLTSKRRHLKTARRNLRKTTDTTRKLLEIAQEQRSRGAELYKAGHLSLSDLEELDRRELQQTATVNDNERALLSINEQLEDLVLDNQSWQDRLNSRLRDIDSELGANTREREQLHMRYEQHLIAPSAGFITGILSHAGSTSTPEIPLITMVGMRSNYSAKLWASSHSAGDLRVGQRVNLMVDAFPHQKHGMLGGEISHINQSPLTLQELGAPWEGPGAAYAVTVMIDKANPLYRRIKPGMNLTADIKLDNSLLVARLFEPLLLAWQRAL